MLCGYVFQTVTYISKEILKYLWIVCYTSLHTHTFYVTAERGLWMMGMEQLTWVNGCWAHRDPFRMWYIYFLSITLGHLSTILSSRLTLIFGFLSEFGVFHIRSRHVLFVSLLKIHHKYNQ